MKLQTRGTLWLTPFLCLIYVVSIPQMASNGRARAVTLPLPSAGSQLSGNEEETPVFAPQKPISCESFLAYLDDSIIRWQASKGTVLIVIARSGSGEAKNLAGFRLKPVSDYLAEHKVKFVAGEGSSVTGSGRIEFYVGGKLLTVIPVRKNSRRVCAGSTG